MLRIPCMLRLRVHVTFLRGVHIQETMYVHKRVVYFRKSVIIQQKKKNYKTMRKITKAYKLFYSLEELLHQKLTCTGEFPKGCQIQLEHMIPLLMQPRVHNLHQILLG